MRRYIRPSGVTIAMVLIAGCSRQPDADTVPTPSPSATTASLAPARPQPLTGTDISEASLKGELGCSFIVARDPLLVAMGNVASADPAQGAVNLDGKIERVAQPGGFDAMTDGGTFTGDALTVRIRATGPSVVRGEAPARPATFSYDRAGRKSATIQGMWHCGP